MVDLPTTALRAPGNLAPSERALPTPRVEHQRVETPRLAELPSPLREAARGLGYQADSLQSQAGSQQATARALESISKDAMDVAKDMAREAGLRSVTLDENGNIKVDKYPIFGEAAVKYKEAMQVSAITKGETVAKEDLLAMRKKYDDENDPEGFRAAAAEYRKTKVEQYEKETGSAGVALSLGRAIDNTAIETYRGLLNSSEHRNLTRAADSIQTQVTETKNELFALKAGGAPDDAPEVQARLQKVGALWGQLASNPRMGISPERVDYEIRALHGELSVAGLDYRMATIQKEKGVGAAMFEAERVLTDPDLNLTQGQRVNFYNRLKGGILQRANEQARVDQGVNQEIDAVGEMAKQGNKPTPQIMANVRAMLAESGNPALAAKLDAVEAAQPMIAALQKGSVSGLDSFIAQTEAVMREHGATPEQMAVRDIALGLRKNMVNGLKDDPLGWAARTGAVKVDPIDFTSPNAPAAMRSRVAAAETVSSLYGTPTQYLTKGEAAALTNVAAQGGQAMRDTAALLVGGFGDRAPLALREVSKEAPTMAHIGQLMTFGGSDAFVRDASDMVAMRQNKELKLPKWTTDPSGEMQSAQTAGAVATYGGAFMLASETERAAIMTAWDAYSRRSLRTGADPKAAATDSKFTEALQEAAGRTTSSDGTAYGGISSYRQGSSLPFLGTTYKVLVPPNVKSDRFADVVRSIPASEHVDAVMANGQPYPQSYWTGAVPVAYGGGYRMALGDPASDDPKWMRGVDGRPYVLSLDRINAQRARVPDAFAGR